MLLDPSPQQTPITDLTQMEGSLTHLQGLHSYQVFKKHDKAKFNKQKKVINAPQGYHKVRVHLIFAVKYDGRCKVRLVADGHLTPDPVQCIYLGVVSLRNLRIVILLGKLNDLELWEADIGLTLKLLQKNNFI